MRALLRRVLNLSPLFVAGLVVALAARSAGSFLDRPRTLGPSSWQPLADDPVGECGAKDVGRDVRQAFWAVEGGSLYVRLCTAGQPGWQSTPDGWTDARYKWFVDTPGGAYLVMLEDASLGGNDVPGGVVSDGRGDLTLVNDPNGNGRFADDWAATSPPAYLDNRSRVGFWRRVSSAGTGPNQSASSADIGFAMGAASCGPAVDIHVRLAAIGSPGQACVSWATDPEGNALDARPSCDSDGPPQCLPLSVASPSPNVPATDTPWPIAPTVTPPATNTARPLPPPATATPTEEPTEVPSQAPTPTDVEPPATPPASPSVTPQTATSTEWSTATKLPPATPTPSPTATQPAGPIVSTPTPTGSALAPPIATPTTMPTATPPGNAPTVTPSATNPVAAPSATAASGTPSALVCVLAVSGGVAVPFPDPATAHMVLLTPFGWPAKPVESRALGPDSCAAFYDLEPGQYRAWVSVPAGWQPVPGTPATQILWVQPNQVAPGQCVFRYMLGAASLPGVVPSPPGPPVLTPGAPGYATPTPTATGYPPSPDRPPVGSVAELPVLGYVGNDAVCDAWVEAQNVGDRPAKALLLVWGEPGFCPPQCAGPLKVECSGLLTPGSAWHFRDNQMPASAKSGMVLSASADQWHGDVFADALCETLFRQVAGDCDDYRRFRKAYDEGGTWSGFDFGAVPSQPLAVEVLRSCPGDVRPSVRVTSSYEGIAGEFLGRWDPVYGGYAFFVPSLFASRGGFTSVLYVQNAGLECSSVELWFQAFDDCLRARICDIRTLAPEESYQFDASSCMPPGWSGSAWVRSSQPLAVAVDQVGNDVLMTYTAVPGELNYAYDGTEYFTTGSAVAYGPLVYSEYQGWDTAVVVQNMSRTTAAKVKVYFLDRSGDVITSVVDWVCPSGAQTFFLPVLANLPGNWVGSVRVESQDWLSPGGPAVSAPNVAAVAQLVQYSDIARSEPQEAIAYNLFPEQLAYDWSLGSGSGGVESGVGRIGLPSFLKDRDKSGVTSEVAIANVVAKPGLTDFALFVYDQNGLIDYTCETLCEQQVEYIDLDNWGFLNRGFRGSALISATFWEHEVFDPRGGFVRNVVGLAAVEVERSGASLASAVPGDESAGSPGFPIPGPFRFAGPYAPSCPGQPPRGGPPTPGYPGATATPPGGVPSPPGPPIP